MDWPEDAAGWPLAERSRFIEGPVHRWHVQEAGSGPTILLLHGAAGATQSWRGLFPLLIDRAHVVALDLPGHGFTKLGARRRSGLQPTAEDVTALCQTEGWSPTVIVGHSAGGVLALELSRHLSPRGVVTLNAALGRFEGVAGWLFPMMAKLLALNPFAPALISRMSGADHRIRELLASTGSQVDDETVALYGRLARDKGHVDGTLAMMAQWNIDGLLARLGAIDVPVLLLVGDQDGTVLPHISHRAAARMPKARVLGYPGRGHLLHEEAPDLVAEEIVSFLDSLSAAAIAATSRR